MMGMKALLYLLHKHKKQIDMNRIANIIVVGVKTILTSLFIIGWISLVLHLVQTF